MYTIKYFKALSEETRLRLFYLLLHYELNVNDIVAVLQMGQSKISRHLKILLDSELLVSRRDGIYIYYSGLQIDWNMDLVRFVLNNPELGKIWERDLNRANEILKERKNKTKRFFESVAGEWDQLKSEVFGGVDLNSMISEKVHTNSTTVDLGCGTGELLVELIPKTRNLIGVDSSVNMLEQARKRLQSKTQAVDLRLGELEHLPLKDEEADCAVLNMVLHYLSVPALGMREVYRVLRPGGGFIIVDFDKHQQEWVREKFGGPWLGFDEQEIRGWLEETGFELQEMQQIAVNKGLTVNIFLGLKN